MKIHKRNGTRFYRGFIAISLFILGACNEQPKKATEPASMTQTIEEVDAPKEIISLNQAKELCENYENRRVPSIMRFEMNQNDGEEKFIPVQFVTFDLQTIKNYIKYVEQEAQKAKVSPDSLRIYLGNYGNKGKEANRNTVFMLPTAKVGNGYGGFYIGDNGQAQLIRNYWPKEGEKGNQPGKSKASFMPTLNVSLMQGGGSLILNRGNSSPPPDSDF